MKITTVASAAFLALLLLGYSEAIRRPANTNMKLTCENMNYHTMVNITGNRMTLDNGFSGTTNKTNGTLFYLPDARYELCMYPQTAITIHKGIIQ